MIVNNLLINKSMNMQMICVFHGDLWGLGKEKKRVKLWFCMQGFLAFSLLVVMYDSLQSFLHHFIFTYIFFCFLFWLVLGYISTHYESQTLFIFIALHKLFPLTFPPF